jgi:hypothetical protein
MELLSKRAQIGDSLIDRSDLFQKNAPRVLRRARTSEKLCQPRADLRHRRRASICVFTLSEAIMALRSPTAWRNGSSFRHTAKAGKRSS